MSEKESCALNLFYDQGVRDSAVIQRHLDIVRQTQEVNRNFSIKDYKIPHPTALIPYMG